MANNSYCVIRNPHSGLVLEVNDYNKVTLQRNTGFPKQLWRFIPNTKDGKVIIMNKGNGKVLDMEGGACSGAQIITSPNEERIIQKWYVKDDTIVSAADPSLALDICAEKFCTGTNIIAYKKHGGKNQKFVTQS